MLLLGLNVSIIGLVFVSSTSFYLIAELFGLTLVLNLVYAFAFIVLEQKHLIILLSRLVQHNNRMLWARTAG